MKNLEQKLEEIFNIDLDHFNDCVVTNGTLNQILTTDGRDKLYKLFESTTKELMSEKEEELKDDMEEVLNKYPHLHLHTYYHDFSRRLKDKYNNIKK